MNGEAAANQDARPIELLSDYDEANFQGTLERIYLTVVPPAELSKAEERLNNMGKVSYSYIPFYNSTIAAIKDDTAMIISGREAESSKALMKVLDEMAKIHPVIAVAVLAFKVVVTLELKRRDNDKKVIALKVEMKDTISILSQLRNVRDPKQLFPDGTRLEGQMQQLMKDIAEDITNCRNICDAHTRKDIDIQRSWPYLSTHFSASTIFVNRALSDFQDGLRGVHDKLYVLFLSEKLEISGAKEIAKFVTDMGGQTACMGNDDLLQQLIVLGWKAQGRQGVNIGSARRPRGRTKNLTEDIDKTLTNNMKLFDRKLKVQQKQLIERQDRDSPDEAETTVTPMLIPSPLPPDDYIEPGTMFDHAFYQQLTSKSDDRWALVHIHITRIKPILEAFDNDRSGFVSAKEANAPTSSRPKGWSLPHWLGY
ncbi:hypothetical protein BDN67DRAFT_1008997 [Paxillus ammoniavirescens]|nr:hypothetical protein BDN67DRAFT_1008997 [Paxillus ammoniavirescens]